MPISSHFGITALKPIALLLIIFSLAGCLSGGGGSGDSPPSAQEPTDPDEPIGPPQSRLEFETEQGVFRGVEMDTMLAFQGIRYAREPVRFTPPVPVGPEDRVDEIQPLSAEFVEPCAQPPRRIENENQASANEDCLFLNVYAPAELKDAEVIEASRPVMVWIHGGDFIGGSAGGKYHPDRLVERGVVVVTINYRVGALGMLAHPALTAEQSTAGELPAVSNYSIMDQQAALQWVRANIGAFGGDPGNVTLFGQSAGGHSILTHMLSPASSGLFHKAIVQSGSYLPGALPIEQAEAWGEELAIAVGCDDPDEAEVLRCLREEASLQDILDNQRHSYKPVASTATLPALSISAGLADPLNQVPTIIGFNRDEGRAYAAVNVVESGPLDADAYRAQIAMLLAPAPRLDEITIADDYLELQNAATPELPLAAIYSLAYAAVLTDWSFACNAIWQANALTNAGGETWGYWFTDRLSDAPLGEALPFSLGASHGAELTYLMYSEAELLSRNGVGETDADDHLNLSNRMLDYWAQFAAAGNPDTVDGVAAAWPRFEALPAGELLELTSPEPASAAVNVYYPYHRCGYWANPPLESVPAP